MPVGRIIFGLTLDLGFIIMTRYIDLRTSGWSREILADIGKLVKAGGVIVFPTETVYGIGGDGTNQAVIDKIYRIKKRSGNKPLVRLITERGKVTDWLRNKGQAELVDRFWPGPLTVILMVNKGRTQGFRIPGHEFIRRVIEISGVEMVATSANRSGKPPITSGKVARREFEGKVDLIIDDGLVSGKASTVLDLSISPPRILREGPVSRSDIESCLGPLAC